MKNKFRVLKYKKTKVLAGIIALLILALFALWSGVGQKTKNPSSTATNSATEILRNGQTTSPGTPAKSPAVTGNSLISDKSLLTPYRVTYASNYSPGSTSDNELSSFSTSPGANCLIEFSMNGYIKDLPLKVADSNGLVHWYWTPKQIGLTAGNWSLKAIAKSGTSTKISTDINTLQIP